MAAGLQHARAYDLRRSFASLLLHQARSAIYVARQLGHGAQLTMGTRGHSAGVRAYFRKLMYPFLVPAAGWRQ